MFEHPTKYKFMKNPTYLIWLTLTLTTINCKNAELKPAEKLIDISTDKGYDKYLFELGVHNWRYVIKHFELDYILGLERPLIFRQLLNYWGDNYDMDAWLNVKEYYAECESDYSYNLFLKYSEELGFIDAEFNNLELE